ncbi:MAG: zinc dependent phospholipase C family protein [Clostridiales bacterium]|nr:zinc dependent phospholipase C family protein [Clostridiales bacterium]
MSMPYNFTHALVGLTALKQSNEAVAALVAAHRGAFLIGTMGPDPFFGDAMPKPLFSPCRVDVANRLHALDARALFAALFPLAAKSDAMRAYTLGFLCHFLLDTTAHPYIEARFFGAKHTPAEIQMDLMMTERFRYAGVPQKPRHFYRTARLKELDALHAALAKRLFSLDIGGAFARSYRKWITVNSVSYDPNNRKLRFFGGLERLLNIPGKLTGYLVSRHPDPDDRLNLNHAAWRAPWDEETQRTESFVELFERACAEAPAVLNAALDAMESGDDRAALALIGARRMDARPV